MSAGWEEELVRLARLARLEVGLSEVGALAAACEAITGDFAALAAFAAPLPEPPAVAAGALRDDIISRASEAEVEGILAAAPRVDAVSREVIVPRGSS